MSRVKTSVIVLASVLLLAGCKTVPSEDEAMRAELEAAMDAALAPATAEERTAADRADPLTRANFWASEYNKDPSNLETALTFSGALRTINSYDRVLDVMGKTIVLHPTSDAVFMEIGRAQIGNMNFAAAADAFNRAAGANPDNVAAWSALGTSLDRMDAHTDAQRAYAKALEIEPTRTSTLTNYGLSLALSGDLIGAEEKLRIAAAQPDATPIVRENLALVLGLNGNFDAMKSASGPNAPPAIVKQNIETLRSLVAPSRSWDALAATAELGTVPDASDMPKPNLPATNEAPSSATSTAVTEERFNLDGAADTPAPKTSPSGLRLRNRGQ